jgi:Trk K+ transport system NAD-binding subunit
LNNHVILCGLGELGFRTLERLNALGDQIAVLDPDPSPAFQQLLVEWGIPLILEEGRTPRALREAGVLTARALIATHNDDMTNLAIALAAREENPDIRLVVHIFNPQLAARVERELPNTRVLDVAALAAPVFAYAGMHDDILHCVDVPGGRFLLRRWNGRPPADATVIAVRRRLGEYYEAGAIGFSVTARPDWDILPDAQQAVKEQDEAFGLVRVDGSDAMGSARRTHMAAGPIPLRERLVRALQRRFRGVAQNPLAPVVLILLVLTAVSASLFQETLHLTWFQAIYFVVTVMTTTGFGDISLKDQGPTIVLFGTGLMLVGAMLMAVLYASITEALLSIRLGTFFERRQRPQRDHFVLCGLGRVACRIAEELQAMGHPIIAVARQENDNRLVEQARRSGVPVLVGPNLHTALPDVNLEEARCLMTLTSDDAENLELALTAQEANGHLRTVVRLFDPHMATLVERSFGLHLARSPSAIAAPAFAVAAAGEDLLDAFEVGEVLWCVGALKLGDRHSFIGSGLGDLYRKDILALSHRRGEAEWDARLADDRRLAAGDELVVLTTHHVWRSLQATIRV